MRIGKFLSSLVDTYGPYIPFVGSSPPTNSNGSVTNGSASPIMKQKRSSAGGSSSPTKGKGKGKGSSNETIDCKDIPLTFAEFSNGDGAQFYPRYSSVLKRSDSDGVGMEDIDTLQNELEAMLSVAVVRKQTLKEEVQVLYEIEKYKGQGKTGRKSGPSSPGKRGASGGKEGRSAKKIKLISGKPASSEANKVIGMPKFKPEPTPAFDPLQNEQIRPDNDTIKPLLPKNETPNRFWAFVEPYCAPITPDDIKLLEDLIGGHGDMNEYFRVPKLGPHYTTRWAKEDLENERNKSSNDPNAEGKDESFQMLKRAENGNDESPFGELTQRLVAGLMEENAINPADLEDNSKKGSGESSDAENAGKSQLIKSLNVTNSENLEARVRRELQEQGILDTNEEGKEENENDEIMEELVRCQSELKSLSNHNVNQLKRLLKAAKEEMARQEIRDKLQQADNEVMEAYRKISQARAKKKPPTKKEREQAWKALKEREIILSKLESI